MSHPAPDKPDRILVRGLSLDVRIGCSPEERDEPQRLLLNLEIILATHPRTADLASTVCWRMLREKIHAALSNRHWILVEDLAEDIAKVVFKTGKNAKALELELRKNPVGADEWVGVRIFRTHTESVEGLET